MWKPFHTVHRVLKVRILKWFAMSFSSGPRFARTLHYDPSMLEKTLENPLGCKEIKPVNPKGNKPWLLIRIIDAEAEAPILWLPDVKSWLTEKDPDAGRDRGQEEKGMTEDEMAGWHHWFNGHEFEQTLGDSEGQGSLVCCSPWTHKELDMTEKLNWSERSLWRIRVWIM